MTDYSYDGELTPEQITALETRPYDGYPEEMAEALHTLAFALRESYDKRDSLRFELRSAQQQRQHDNEYLLDQIDELKGKLEVRREWLHESNAAEIALMNENGALRRVLDRAHQALSDKLTDVPSTEERELLDDIRALVPTRRRRLNW